jgi:hypothetical protein
MAGLSSQIKRKAAESNVIENVTSLKKENVISTTRKDTVGDDKFSLTKDEVTFILAKLAQMDFKGVEIELMYNLIVKLQERYKYLTSK